MTITGDKLRGRKRDPSVLEKAWETAPVSDPNPYHAGDDLLIKEFIAGIEAAEPDNVFISVPRSACEAAIRRLRSTF